MVKDLRKTLELLSPAANADTAVQAILHGADAVYIGATSHGARKSAANSIEDITKVAEFAHRYRAKVYVTVNTIVYEDELRKVERLCRDLYRAGVDALIVQDMALLRLDLPPIPLHASTQCDIRTPEKAIFLQEVGFSQLVLARELTLPEIKIITESVDIPVECFVHGALCVSYSGKCHASFAATGRSANRGECAQLCRLPYTLKDRDGKIIVKDKHLLSLKDFNAYGKLEKLIEAGVSSFKIEGRLKDAAYVKNITALYNEKLNSIIAHNPGLKRNSYGKCDYTFTAQPDKSFNRGFTDYFLSERRPLHIASLDTPKSMGEIVRDISMLHNGDGISYFDRNGVYQGVNVNRVDNGRILTGRKTDIPRGTEIHRTFDLEWQKKLQKESSKRKIRLDIELDTGGLTASDERGVKVRIPLDTTRETARRPMDYSQELSKLGNTIYSIENFRSTLDPMTFIPNSEVSVLRRRMVSLLDEANKATYPVEMRREENPSAVFPARSMDFRENVANSISEEFYRSHGVFKIESAMETGKTSGEKGTVVMTTRHCILRELGKCLKETKESVRQPLRVCDGFRTFSLRFNCKDCEMQLLTD